MVNIDTFNQIKRDRLSGKAIMELMAIPCMDDELQLMFHDRDAHITGEHTDCNIHFDSNYYIVTNVYPNFVSRTHRNYEGVLMQQDAIFPLGREKMMLCQIYDHYHPKEITRYLCVMDENKTQSDASFTRYLNKERMFRSKESFEQTKDSTGIVSQRVLEDSRSMILTNYHVEQNGDIQNRTISTCSQSAPTIFTYTMPIPNIEHLNSLCYYHEPVVVIDGQFDHLRTNDSLKYQLLILKREGKFDVLLSLDGKEEKQYFTVSYPGNQEDLSPEEIGELITHFQEEGFLSHETYPLEDVLVKELKQMKKELVDRTYLSTQNTDYFDMLLSQNIPFEQLSCQLGENLQFYYDQAKKSKETKKGYYC